MRYSEAVKRYKLENKQRMLNSILEAAEKERSASPSADNYGYYYGTEETERETRKKETITMRSTQINEVRSRKGGMIAAACAALLIGGGVMAFARQGAVPIDDIKTTPATAASSAAAADTSSQAVTSAAEAEKVVTDIITNEIALTADTSSEAEAANPVEETVTTLPETVVPEVTTTAAKVTGKTTFSELLASSNTIYMGQVTSSEPSTLEMSDGTVKNVIRYTLGGNYYMYDISRNRLRQFHNAETMVLQEVSAGTEAQIKPGETALFMTGEATLADINGGFVYDSSSHQLFNATYSNDAIALGMRDYMLNVILDRKDSITVSNFISTLGETLDDSITEERSDLPTDIVDGISWNSNFDLYEATINYNPKSSRIREIQQKGQFTNITGTKSSQKISGFDDVDIDITSVGYTSDMTAVTISLTATPKNGLDFDPGVLYALSYDYENSGLSNISGAVNADATLLSEGLYYPVGSNLTFTIMFDQAGTDGPMEFDPDTEFTFTINGISASNGNNISGEYKFSYTYDPSAIASVGNAKVVTRETATNKNY